MKHYSLMGFMVLLMLFALCACGRSHKDNPPPQPTATHLYYFNNTTGGLFFYDPVTKATTTVETGGITGGESEFVGGSYNAAASQLTDVHFKTMVYAKNDGKLYKVSLLKSGTHTPVQVSNETGASIICSNSDIPDLANPNNSIYAYELPGIDGDCSTTGDNISKAVRLSSSPTTTPMEITSLNMEPVTDIRDWSTGGIVGELAVNQLTDALEKCTTDFTTANCTTILSSPTFTVREAGYLGADFNAKKIYLFVFDGAEYQLRTYDSINNIISAPVYTTLNALAVSPGGLQDSGAAYFGEDWTLKKMTFGTIPAVVSLFTNTPGYFINGLLLTDNSIVYTDYLTSSLTPTYTLRSALKTGGTPSVLATAIYPATLELVLGTGNAVFYNVVSGSTYTAGYIKDDGTGKHEVGGGRWTAASYSNTMNVPSGQVAPAKMIMSKSNGELRSFDAATYSASTTGLLLGAMPTAEGLDTFYGGAIGSNVLGYDVNPNGDIFTVNVNTFDSLDRVTDTPSEDERPYLW